MYGVCIQFCKMAIERGRNEMEWMVLYIYVHAQVPELRERFSTARQPIQMDVDIRPETVHGD